MKIQVLMSTYNGQKHVREQLDSILTQTMQTKSGCELELVVRDDGSRDETCQILAEYEEKYDNVQIYREKNVGVIASFFDLIQKVGEDVDFIALSDQDDVWMPDKLECAVDCLSKDTTGRPLLYCGKPMLTDEELNPIPSIMYGDHVRPSFGNAMIENICAGCTAVLNRKLIELVQVGTPAFTVMHDWWIYLIASCFGKVFFDPVPHMYYRQHGDNTVGVQMNYWNEFIARIKRFRSNRYNIHKQLDSFEKSCEKISKETTEVIPTENKELIKQMLMAKDQIGMRIKLVKTPQVYRQRKGDNFIFSMILLTGTM